MERSHDLLFLPALSGPYHLPYPRCHPTSMPSTKTNTLPSSVLLSRATLMWWWHCCRKGLLWTCRMGMGGWPSTGEPTHGQKLPTSSPSTQLV